MKLRGKGLAVSVLILLPVSSFAIVGYSYQKQHPGLGVAHFDGKTYQQKPLSTAQKQEIAGRTQLIITKHGQFERSQPKTYPANEIAYSVTNVTKKTQELVLSNGDFIRTTNAALKQQEMQDPKWAQHHTQSWIQNHKLPKLGH